MIILFFLKKKINNLQQIVIVLILFLITVNLITYRSIEVLVRFLIILINFLYI